MNIQNNCLFSKQVEISNTLRRLWMEHVLWTRFFIVSTAFELPDLSFVTERLLRNPQDFADVLRPFYGRENAMRFYQLFTAHLQIAASLVNAAKAGNTAEAEHARRQWYQNAQAISRFLASINPYWNENEWQRMLFEHLRMTENEAVFILTGRYDRGIREYDDIQAQALEMANVMTRGIVRQFHIG